MFIINMPMVFYGFIDLFFQVFSFHLNELENLNRHHEFVIVTDGKLSIIHQTTEEHMLPDFKVVPITTNMYLVARIHMTKENSMCSKIC